MQTNGIGPDGEMGEETGVPGEKSDSQSEHQQVYHISEVNVSSCTMYQR